MQIDGCFKIHLAAENQEESSILIQMSRSVCCPVESYGAIDEEKTWAWFFLPLRKGMNYKAKRFGNKK